MRKILLILTLACLIVPGIVAQEESTGDSDAATEAAGGEGAAPEEVSDDPIGMFFDKMQEVIGMEVGALTIGETTYSKAIIRPTIPLGKLTLGLYLPIVYQGEMFNVSNWYMPRGNNEWSFGTDQDWNAEPAAAAKDVLDDLLLKIRFIGYGNKRDPLFLKVGNLSGITLGHGLIMDNYTNNSDFPVVRRIGIDAGVNLDYFGLEVIANDLIMPEIFGGRVYVRPFGSAFPLALGVSGIADINPRSIAEDDDQPNPVIVNGGVDLDYPIISTGALNLLAYADAAAMVPYFKESTEIGTDPNTKTVPQGFQVKTVMTEDGEFKNFGAAAGVKGNIATYNWKLEARFFNGTFRPAYFDKTYDRMRYTYVEDLLAYMLNPDADEYSGFVLGVFGHGGFDIPEVFTLDSGYMWPWDIRDNQVVISEEDKFYIRGLLDRSVIPYADMELSFEYDRRRLVTPFFSDEYETPEINDFADFVGYLMNSDTVVQAQAKKGLGDLLDIVFTYKVTLERDQQGNLVTVDGIPQVVSTTSLETSFNY